MNSIHWRPCLSLALHCNRHSPQARFAQLATVRGDGRPANRTLVFRDFLEGTDRLIFTTDDRSRKVEELGRSWWGEACWYFPETREQFRLLGRLGVVGAEEADARLAEARVDAWKALSAASRLPFEWPRPGEPRAGASGFDVFPPDPARPSRHFALLLLDPVEVDHLELRPSGQERWSYRTEDGRAWTMQAINP